MRMECHIHTRFSKDSLLGKRMLLLFCKIRKIEGIIITDHNSIRAWKYKEYLENRGIFVVIGEEIMTQEGEIIGLFLKEKVMPMMSADITIQEIKRQGGFVYIPHPFDQKRYKTVLDKAALIRNSADIDFIEEYNGRNSLEYDCAAEKLICQQLKKQNPNIVCVVGSDAHIGWELGRNVCEISEKLTPKNAKNNLANAKMIERRPIAFAHHWTKFVKCLRLFQTLETMQYDIASMMDVSRRSRLLAAEVKKDFQPDIIIFVAKGGFLIGKAFSEYFQVPLYALETERVGSGLKKVVAPIFKLLPKRCRFWMIDLEMNLGIHKKAKNRKVIIPEGLKRLSERQNNPIKKVLITDDSVDTGMTALAIKKATQGLFPNAEVRFASLSVIRFSESAFKTDYCLYKDTIIATATSKDSPEYAEFLKQYKAWMKE